jgi:hypothetical protein
MAPKTRLDDDSFHMEERLKKSIMKTNWKRLLLASMNVCVVSNSGWPLHVPYLGVRTLYTKRSMFNRKLGRKATRFSCAWILYILAVNYGAGCQEIPIGSSPTNVHCRLGRNPAGGQETRAHSNGIAGGTRNAGYRSTATTSSKAP